MNLLIVDDQRIICDGLKTLVMRLKIPEISSIRTAYGADRALNIARETPVDILITDIRMPGKTGLDLIADIRLLRPEVRSIVVTGHNDFDLVRQALRLEAIDYLLKPATREELRAALMRAIGETGLKDRTEGQEGDGRLGYFQSIVDAVWPWAIGESDIAEETRSYLDRSFREIVGLSRVGLMSVEHPSVDVFALTGETMDATASTLPEKLYWTLKALGSSGVAVVVAAVDGDTIDATFAQVRNRLERTLPAELRFTASGPGYGVEALPGLYSKCVEARIAKLSGRSASDGTSLQNAEIGEDMGRRRHEFIDVINMVARGTEVSEELFDRLTGALEGLVALPREAAAAWSQARKTILEAGASRKSELDVDGLESYFTMDAAVSDLVNAAAEGVSSRLGEHPVVNRAMEYVTAHYSEPHTMNDVADALGLSYSYFSALFKSQTGKPFSRYLLEVRMGHARRYLEDPTLPVAEVARRVGYVYPKHFSRAFRRFFGTSPRQYALDGEGD